MNWKIEYYNSEVEQNILALPNSLLTRYLRLAKLMLEFGPNLGMPHTRAIGQGLFDGLKVRKVLGVSFIAPLLAKESLEGFMKFFGTNE